MTEIATPAKIEGARKAVAVLLIEIGFVPVDVALALTLMVGI